MAQNVTMDDQDPSIRYSFTNNVSHWKEVSGKGRFADTTAVTNTMGAYANISFVGVAAAVRADYWHDHGKFQVVLDGDAISIGSSYRNISVNVDGATPSNQTIYATPKLLFGPHLLQLINLGRQDTPADGDFLAIDSVLVQITDGLTSTSLVASATPLNPAPPPRYDWSHGSGSRFPIIPVVAGAVGGLVVLVLIAVFLFWRCRKRRSANKGLYLIDDQNTCDPQAVEVAHAPVYATVPSSTHSSMAHQSSPTLPITSEHPFVQGSTVRNQGSPVDAHGNQPPPAYAYPSSSTSGTSGPIASMNMAHLATAPTPLADPSPTPFKGTLSF